MSMKGKLFAFFMRWTFLGSITTTDSRRATNPTTPILNVVEADLAKYADNIRALSLIDIPERSEWILDPRFKMGLGDLEFHVIIHHGKFKKATDQLVHLDFFFGKLQVRIRPNRKQRGHVEVIHPSDICNVPDGGVKTKAVPTNPREARGLYLVVSADDVKLFTHIGKLVRHICDALNELGEFGNHCDGSGVYLCQRVDLHPVPGRGLNYEEEIVEEHPFKIHHSHLLSVYQMEHINSTGNRLMYDVRKRFGGLTLPCDEPDGKEKARQTKERVTSVIESIHNLEERIYNARKTPPPPPQPGPIDWDKVSLV
ncbi:hypothetical protein GYMLUDRAFT_240630 [Collybiopsis luxurians FD-317 M1]|nr:hypothetical protein GYMLUDRAFT_240630 [Collybiopsis luxurians FD-317 M1]